jgi:hypothetical protein
MVAGSGSAQSLRSAPLSAAVAVVAAVAVSGAVRAALRSELVNATPRLG